MPIQNPGGWRERRYGRILGRDIESYLGSLRTFACHGEEIRGALSSASSKEFWRALAERPNWANYYLVPFEHLLAKFAIIAQVEQVLLATAAEEFPADHVGALQSHLDSAEPNDAREIVPLIFALIANLEAIGLFSLSMTDLMNRVRETGCETSLLRAASIDSGVLSLPPAQFYFKALQFCGMSGELARALKCVARGPHKRRAPYQELRCLEYMLREQGAFEACTQVEIHSLLVDHLGVYGNDDEHENSQKALFALFRKWRKEAEN